MKTTIKTFKVTACVRVGHTVRPIEKYIITTSARKARDYFYSKYPHAKNVIMEECEKK